MKKLLIAAALTLALAAPSLADSNFGVVVAPQQAKFTANTQYGLSYRLVKHGAFNLSAIAVTNDATGVHYGASANVHVFSNTEVGIGDTINFESRTLSRPFLALTIRL